MTRFRSDQECSRTDSSLTWLRRLASFSSFLSFNEDGRKVYERDMEVHSVPKAIEEVWKTSNYCCSHEREVVVGKVKIKLK